TGCPVLGFGIPLNSWSEKLPYKSWKWMSEIKAAFVCCAGVSPGRKTRKIQSLLSIFFMIFCVFGRGKVVQLLERGTEILVVFNAYLIHDLSYPELPRSQELGRPFQAYITDKFYHRLPRDVLE